MTFKIYRQTTPGKPNESETCLLEARSGLLVDQAYRTRVQYERV